jgi:glycosyltransferase involved in cell wall biosynthesis
MIVKNEAHCIRKCLESVEPYIDYWIICDTGSSDNTEEVIKNSLKGIPGEFHYHEWVDFSTNRNLSLQLAKNKADFTLIIDADDYFVNENQRFTNLKPIIYNIKIKHGSISYHRPQLIHNSINAKYIGVLHEYLWAPSNTIMDNLPECHIFYGATGARSKDPNKYLRDADILEKALLIEPNNARNVFYCAQSFRDANVPEKAINYYRQRSEMGGWDEEVYMSLLNVAQLTERLNPNDFNEIESAYIKAYNYKPTRAESLCYLASHCRNNNFFEKSYFYSKIGAKIKLSTDGLFIENNCYNFRMQDELAIAAYYIGKLDEARQINIKLLKTENLSEEHRVRIYNNLQFCTKT